MWALHEPLLPFVMVLSMLSTGRSLSGTWPPDTPWLQVKLRPVRAPVRVMASRLSDLAGRLMTKSFSNCLRVKRNLRKGFD